MRLFYVKPKPGHKGLYSLWGLCGRAFTIAIDSKGCSYIYCRTHTNTFKETIELGRDKMLPECPACLARTCGRLKSDKFELVPIEDYSDMLKRKPGKGNNPK